MDYVGIHVNPMHDVMSEAASGSCVRSHSDRSVRLGKSYGSSRSGSQRSARSVSAAHVPHPDPSTPAKMDSENVSTKRSEPEAPKVDLTFDCPENPKNEKQPKKEADPVMPYPMKPMFGSAMVLLRPPLARRICPLLPRFPIFPCSMVRAA